MSNTNSKLDTLQQLMIITMEECGELIQRCSKWLRKNEYYDDKKLLEEVGDVYTMIELMHEFDIISWNDVEERVKFKRNKLKKWSSLVNE